jgi:hypothetical protein
MKQFRQKMQYFSFKDSNVQWQLNASTTPHFYHHGFILSLLIFSGGTCIA